jgi:hypothetical protein
MVIGKDEEAAVVGDQVEAIILVTEIPADPGIPRGARPCGGGEAQLGHPLAMPGGDIPQGMANLWQRPQVVMRLHQRLEALLFGGDNRL